MLTRSLLCITGGRPAVSKEFANALGRPSDAGATGWKNLARRCDATDRSSRHSSTAKLNRWPCRRCPAHRSRRADIGFRARCHCWRLCPTWFAMRNVHWNHFVGLGVGTTSCNNGDQPLNWFALSNTDHPVIPQNLYRMSPGLITMNGSNKSANPGGNTRLRHWKATLQLWLQPVGCDGHPAVPGLLRSLLSSSLNMGQTGIGSRAWVNPFTRRLPIDRKQSYRAHSHWHVAPGHGGEQRSGPRAESRARPISPKASILRRTSIHGASQNPGQCNMYNNALLPPVHCQRQPDNFTFSPVGSTVRTQPAIMAWTGATVNQVEPDPGNDGIWFMGYKVTNPTSESGTMSTLSITRTSTGPSNHSVCRWALE